jgi:uncharacterized protein YqgQ
MATFMSPLRQGDASGSVRPGSELQHQMLDDELTIVYYIANLILQEQYSLANSIIEKQLIRLKQCTNTFNGNIRRL